MYVLLAIELILSLVAVPILLVLFAREHARRLEAQIDRAIWPWAKAYMDLRDERDQDGELFKGDS